MGGGPGLVVMGGDTCLRGREFVSQAPDTRWLDIHILF